MKRKQIIKRQKNEKKLKKRKRRRIVFNEQECLKRF